MSVKKKPAIPPYEAFGDELSAPVALLQAAAVLDITAELAVESRDTETLVTVSALWMQLAERLMAPRGGPREDDDEEDDDELSSEPQYPVGFAGAKKEMELDEDE